DYIITFQEKKGDVFHSIRERIQLNQGKVRSLSNDYLYYILLDALVDNYLDVLELMKRNINMLEENIINEDQLDIKDIHNLRKTLLFLRITTTPFEKFIGAQREKKDPTFLSIDPIYIENLYDHVKESANEVVLQKEMVDALFENYMFNNSNDMNKIMTTLTIFSAIFIPLTLLAGIFGMNFQHMPGLSNPNGFYVFLITGGVLMISMIGFFKAKKWF
ncbi:MAG: magnesium and cobalt transport protein CorA, partial [Vallitaleaceae bacterium]|nr:magnesium and cobalt transport protein CorA [Vallitaleaceae bacterium]